MYALEKVDKRFPGVHALKAVNFHVGRGEIVGLVGENGAGKSTLMKVIYGAYQPDGGQILIDGKAVRFSNPRQAMEKGIGMVFQEQSLIANLTVMENIFLGYERQFVRFGVINWRAMAEAARRQLAKVKLDLDPATVTEGLRGAGRPLRRGRAPPHPGGGPASHDRVRLLRTRPRATGQAAAWHAQHDRASPTGPRPRRDVTLA